MENQVVENKIFESIKLICSFDKIEKEHLNDALNWISTSENIFRIKKDALPPKHLVSYAVVVDLEKEKVLLLDHKKALLLLPSGGHVDVGEMPFDTAKRELFEELGLKLNSINQNSLAPFFVSVMETVGISEKHIDVCLWYVFSCDSTKELNCETDDFKREFENYHWLKFDEILNMSLKKFDVNMHRFVCKLKKYLDEKN